MARGKATKKGSTQTNVKCLTTGAEKKTKAGEKAAKAEVKKRIDAAVKSAVKRTSKKIKKKKEDLSRTPCIPTCSTQMNLACTDKPANGFLVGRMVNIIGDSSAGKSIFALGCLAEVAQLKEFDRYQLIYDDAEEADEFDKSKLFGKKLAERIGPPERTKKGKPVYSNTIQDFQCHMMDRLEEGKPFIYVLDSFDSLTADEDLAKTEQMREARARNKKAKGSYGMAKPKIASGMFNQLCGALNKGESILIIISQTRDNIDPMSFEKKTRSGGKALKFYATHEIWLAMAGMIKSKELVIGNKVKFRVKKNKRTGKQREGWFSIYYDYGLDDTRSCIEYLEKQGHWKKKKNTILAKEFGTEATLQKLIHKIEDMNGEKKLRTLTGEVWMALENSVKLNRKSRYK